MNPALFLDRDGILNEMVYDETHGLLDSPRRPEQVRLVPGSADLINAARSMDYEIVVVTNQPGIAKGTLTKEHLDAVNGRLADLLRQQGAAWDAIYHCPHHPRGSETGNEFVRDCDCRKPKPGMLLRAATERNLDLARSWMVGDGVVDVQAGKAAGCGTILVANLKLELVQKFLASTAGLPDVHVPDVSHVNTALSAR
jgi:D-glycero-D-manno-heptose 1,7-bisphosphate phosphatase